eukprot:8125768-Alexandrium_andersonii.AAC.1
MLPQRGMPTATPHQQSWARLPDKRPCHRMGAARGSGLARAGSEHACITRARAMPYHNHHLLAEQ